MVVIKRKAIIVKVHEHSAVECLWILLSNGPNEMAFQY